MAEHCRVRTVAELRGLVDVSDVIMLMLIFLGGFVLGYAMCLALRERNR